MRKLFPILESHSASVLRVGMAVVILWFSMQQFLNPADWVAYVPDSIVSALRMSAVSLVYFNAAFELVFGLMLLLGIYTRLAAALLAIHLFDIIWVVGYGQIAVRDFGLAVATLVVCMNGPDALCLMHKKRIE